MPRVGLWGAFDRENYGDVLFPRVARMMLEARVPELELRVFTPLGYMGRNRYDDGAEPSESLGMWSPERIDSLARETDMLIIGGGEIVHDRHFELAGDYGLSPQEMERRQPFRFLVDGLGEHEIEVPTAWHGVGVPFSFGAEEAERIRRAVGHRAYLTVRDELSRDKLVAAGVDREVVVVPDSVFAISRLYPIGVLEQRVGEMRAAGVYPTAGALVLQGSRSLLDHADAIAEQASRLCRSRHLVPVLAETGPIHGDGEFVDALAERLPEAVRLPAATDLQDLTAAIACSAGFVGSSLHGNVVAAAFDRPGLFLDLARQAKLEGQAMMLDAPERHVDDVAELASAFARVTARGSIGDHVDHLRRRLDEHFDWLAKLALSAGPRVGDATPSAVAAGFGRVSEPESHAPASRMLASRMSAQQAAFADRESDLRERIRTLIDLRSRDQSALGELDELVRRLKEEIAWMKGLLEEREGLLRENEGLRREQEELHGYSEELRRRSWMIRFRTWFRWTGPGRVVAKLLGRDT